LEHQRYKVRPVVCSAMPIIPPGARRASTTAMGPSANKLDQSSYSASHYGVLCETSASAPKAGNNRSAQGSSLLGHRGVLNRGSTAPSRGTS
jgi:hypothetical protein